MEYLSDPAQRVVLRFGMRPADSLITALIGWMLFLLAGCTTDIPPADTGDSALFTQLNTSGSENIRQLNGSNPPRWIVDVKSTGMALLNLSREQDRTLLLTCGSTLDRWKKGESGFPPLLFSIDDRMNLTPIEGAAGIPSLPWTSGCAAADLDADGDDDLLLTGIGGSLLLRNENGRFEPVPDSGILTDSWCTSAAFGDLDLDGDLDLFVCRYLDFPFDSPPENGEEWSCLWENQEVLCGPRGLPATQDMVFENLGNWKFADRTRDWGFENAPAGYGLAVTIVDLYGDPHPGIFVANDSCSNHLWVRQKDGTWLEDGLLSGLGVDQDGQEQAGMGVAIAGLDAAGGLDLAVTNFERESINLYQNIGDGTFQDIAPRSGLSSLTRSTLGWGIGISDFDLDGTPDLFICNGHVYPQADLADVSPGYLQMDQLLMGFRTKSEKLFFKNSNEQIANQRKHVGRCLILADLDKDGDVDAISSSLNGSPNLYRNNTNPNTETGIESANIRLVQSGMNRNAIGATIQILDTPYSVEYPMLRNCSFQSSGFAAVTLPLQNVEKPHRVAVKWPDGMKEIFLITNGPQTLEKGRGQKP